MIEDIVKILDVDMPSEIGKKLILSWEEISKMSKNGIEFGARTVSHPIMTKINMEQVQNKIEQSKDDIQNKIDKTIVAFSYPNASRCDYNL